MKALITSIQTALQGADVLSYVRNRDVFISPVENYIPKLVRGHSIGIVPGPEDRSELVGNEMDIVRSVKVVCWLGLLEAEVAVIGDIRNKGLLDMSDDVDSVLDENYLGLPWVEAAFCKSFAEPRPFGAKQQGHFLIRRTLTYQYEGRIERG